nr:uncharacterized protein LOC104113718 [Nicotiana tomentosiformis]
MVAPPNFEEGQSTYKPPSFNGQYYGWRKTRMHDFIMVEDSELSDLICDGPFVPMKTVGEGTTIVPKMRKEYNYANRKAIEKNFRAKKILICGIRPDEYNCISACQNAKEIWEALQIVHEGTTQVKQSKIDILTTEYELFRMKDDKSIQDMYTHFTSIINELHSLGEIIPRNKHVRKILSVLPGSWDSKVNAITEAKDLQKLTIDELIGEIEHERDDLVVVAVNLRETIESLKREKDILTERIANIEHERDALLVVVVDLKEIIEKLRRESRPMNTQKGKEVESEARLRLENELKSVKSSLCVELEKNRQLQEYLGRVKSDLEKSLKWTWSSDGIAAMYTNSGGNMQGIGFQKEKTPLQPTQQGAVKGSSQRWYMDSGCSKHMNGSTNDFLSLKALQGGSEALGKFDTKSDKGIFLGYSSKSNAYKVYKKRTQCVEESIHVIFDEAQHPLGKTAHDKANQDGELSNVPGEVIGMENGKADMMSQVKESNDNGTAESPADIEEPGPSITITEVENRVVDVVH